MKGRPWTDAQRELLRREYPDTRAQEIAALLGVTVRSVYYHAGLLGLKKSDAFLASDKSNRWKAGQWPVCGTRFNKGFTPWNKGKKGYQPGGRSALTRFQPGQRAPNAMPLGSEVITADGYRKRKTKETGIQHVDWVFVHLLVWEEHHGPVPTGSVVIFEDGDFTNLHIDNLVLLTRAELLYLNRNAYNRLPPELRPSAIALAKVECRRREIERGKTKEQNEVTPCNRKPSKRQPMRCTGSAGGRSCRSD